MATTDITDAQMENDILLNLFTTDKLLSKAIDTDNKEAVQILINRISTFDTDEKYQNLITIYSYSQELVFELIKNGKIIEKYQNELFIHAARHNFMELFTSLIDNNIDINYVSTDYNQTTALIIACIYGNLDIVKVLISKDVNVNFENKNGNTPLIAVIQENSRDVQKITELLLDNGAEINYQNKDKISALICACNRWNENAEIIKYLISQGADVKLQDSNGKTARDRVTSGNRYLFDVPKKLYYGLLSNKKKDINLPLLEIFNKGNEYYYVFPLDVISGENYKLPNDKQKCLSYLVDTDTTEGLFWL